MAEKKEWRLELMLGCKVRAQDGRVVGRLEEFRAEREHDYYVITEFHMGPTALIERLAARHLGITWPSHAHGYRIRWDQLDLEDPEHPRLTCPLEELERMTAPRRARRAKKVA